MDMQLYLRVLWRFRLLIAIGVLLAFAVAFLSFVRVTFEGGGPAFAYRQSEVWSSRGTLWVTSGDFAIGRLLTDEPEAASPTANFTSLAALYATLAQGDAVRQIVLQDGPLNAAVEVRPIQGSERNALPFISVEALSASPGGAVSAARRQVDAILEYVERQQDADNIPRDERVVLKILAEPRSAAVVSGRSYTRPIVILLTVLIAVVGLAFILENLRPRVRPVAQHDVRPIVSRETERRSA